MLSNALCFGRHSHVSESKIKTCLGPWLFKCNGYRVYLRDAVFCVTITAGMEGFMRYQMGKERKGGK